MLLTNLTEVNPEEAQETLEALGGFFHNLNLRTLLTIGLLIVACLVVMKIVLRLLDRTFRRLELERERLELLRMRATGAVDVPDPEDGEEIDEGETT